MKCTAKVVDPAVIIAKMRALTKSEVLIGVPAKNAPRDAEEDEARKQNGESINNAEIGYINEFGVPEKNIPARPHLIPGIKKSKERIAKALVAGAKGTLSGNAEAGATALTKAGLIGETSVKGMISDGLSPALSPVTVLARNRQRKTKSIRAGEQQYADMVNAGMSREAAAAATGIKPLLNTGAYRNSITHVVVPKGQK